MSNRFVLYHGNCWDGFGAAWAAWRALGESAEYIPVFYGNPLPDLPDGAIVAIVDFSYPRQVLLDLKHRCTSLVVLDHHKTAQADLEGLDFVTFVTFDMEKSGAVLAWESWHPHTKVPILLRYIEDRDLWLFVLPDSRKVSAWMRSYPYSFRTWDVLAKELETDFMRVTKEGNALLRFQAQQVEDMSRRAVVGEIGGHQVPIVNATVFFSDVGERLCELYPEAPFAAYYMDRADGMRQWGLRSRGDFDVSEVARAYGGGGHLAAAGFQQPYRSPLIEVSRVRDDSH